MIIFFLLSSILFSFVGNHRVIENIHLVDLCRKRVLSISLAHIIDHKSEVHISFHCLTAHFYNLLAKCVTLYGIALQIKSTLSHWEP